MRLGARQMYLLTRLGELDASGAKASDLSGCEMRPEQAASALKRLESRNLVRRPGGTPGHVSTWTDTWTLTENGRDVLGRMHPEDRKSADWSRHGLLKPRVSVDVS